MRRLNGALVVAALAMLAAPVPSLADVVFTESMASKVERSTVLALAQFAGAEGKGPFTNATPPMARFLVTRAIRGCTAGNVIRVPGWGRAREPRDLKGRETAQEIRAALEAWAGTSIPLPAPGTEVALMLGGRGLPARFHVPFPDALLAPSARDVEMLQGLATFRADVAPSGDLEVRKGEPVVISLSLSNDGPESARFEFSTLRLTTSTPGGDRQAGLVPASSAGSEGPATVDIGPGDRKDVSWNLSRMYPGLFVAPGDYWLELEAPARGAEKVARHVVIVERSLAFACGRAAAILRSRVAPRTEDPSHVNLVDPILLRLRGPRLPLIVAWPTGTPVPAPGTRVILCGGGSRISWVESDSVEARQRVKELILSDPGDLWPREEDLDPRFAPPPGSEQPGSELRRSSLERRLEAE